MIIRLSILREDDAGVDVLEVRSAVTYVSILPCDNRLMLGRKFQPVNLKIVDY
jgi:hypothetical protein